MSNRVRLSTVALTVVFAGVLALDVEVRPPPVAVAGKVTVESTTTAPGPTPSRAPTSSPTSTQPPSRTATTTPSPPSGSTTGPVPTSELRFTPTAEPTSIPGTGSP